MSTSVTWRGREVEHPFWRAVVVLVSVIGIAVGMLFLALFLAVTIPLAVLLYVPLRLAGRKGTIRREWEDGKETLHLGIDAEAFRRP